MTGSGEGGGGRRAHTVETAFPTMTGTDMVDEESEGGSGTGSTLKDVSKDETDIRVDVAYSLSVSINRPSAPGCALSILGRRRP